MRGGLSSIPQVSRRAGTVEMYNSTGENRVIDISSKPSGKSQNQFVQK